MRLNPGYPQDQMQDPLSNAIIYKYFETIQPNYYRYFAEDIIFALDNEIDLAKAIDGNPRMVKGWGALKDIQTNPLSTTLRRDPDALKLLADDLTDPDLAPFIKSHPKGLNAWNTVDGIEPKTKMDIKCKQ